ncbi:DUF2199 domain-containing protein [Erythrobacter sp. HA6-11]
MGLFGFGKKKRDAAARLEEGTWRCASCDEDHGWPFDLAADCPDVWPHEVQYEHNSALRLDGDFLSEDFCVLEGKYFMVRAVLPIPVIGLQGDFAFGCWSTLSRANFDKYIDGFDSGEYADMGPWDGWLMNRLASFNEEPDPLLLEVRPSLDRMRPKLWVVDEDHPLGIAQRSGITPDRMLEVFARYGHAPA